MDASSKRLESMEAGVAELEIWLTDLIRQGLAAAESQPASFWENLASRMVDAKLSGIGRRLRRIPALFSAADWNEKLLGEIAELYLFVKGFQRFDRLPEPLQQELLAVAGVTVRKEEILKDQGIRDNWLILGQTEGAEENLRLRRVWMLGEKCRRFALFLDFAWGQADFLLQWPTGAAIHAELVFYPGSYPLRALPKEGWTFSTAPFQGWTGYADLNEMAEGYAQAIAANPWLLVFPALFNAITPVAAPNGFFLVDQTGQQIRVRETGLVPWRLLALSGGYPMQVFGEWDGEAIAPLCGMAGGSVVAL